MEKKRREEKGREGKGREGKGREGRESMRVCKLISNLELKLSQLLSTISTVTRL